MKIVLLIVVWCGLLLLAQAATHIQQDDVRSGEFAFAALTTTTNVVFAAPFAPGRAYDVHYEINSSIAAVVTLPVTSKTTNGFTLSLIGLTGGVSGQWRAVGR